MIGTSSTAAKAAANRNNNPPQTAEAKPKGTNLWKYRPYTRVIKGYKAHTTVKNYIQLNEKEAQGKIIYRKERLKGLSAGEWELLWV